MQFLYVGLGLAGQADCRAAIAQGCVGARLFASLCAGLSVRNEPQLLRNESGNVLRWRRTATLPFVLGAPPLRALAGQAAEGTLRHSRAVAARPGMPRRWALRPGCEQRMTSRLWPQSTPLPQTAWQLPAQIGALVGPERPPDRRFVAMAHPDAGLLAADPYADGAVPPRVEVKNRPLRNVVSMASSATRRVAHLCVCLRNEPGGRWAGRRRAQAPRVRLTPFQEKMGTRESLAC